MGGVLELFDPLDPDSLGIYWDDDKELEEWHARRLQQAQLHLEIAVRKSKEAMPDDEKWWNSAILEPKQTLADIDARMELVIEITISLDDPDDVLETEGGTGERDAKQPKVE